MQGLIVHIQSLGYNIFSSRRGQIIV